MPILEELRTPDSKRTILVVEDNELNRSMLCSLLEDEYECLEAANGREGFNILRERYEDLSLVLLDVYMPVCDGFEFLFLRQGDARYASVPVIITTASGALEDEVRCLKLGANDFVVKPYNVDVIVNRVRNIVRLRESASIVNQLRWDELTGLYRLEFFQRRVDALLEGYGDVDYDLAVCDVRNLKSLNERYGHERCDVLLHDLAQRLLNTIPKVIVGGRVGGDEFAFLVEHGDFEWQTTLDPVTQDIGIGNLYLRVGIVEHVDHELGAKMLCDRAQLAIDELHDGNGIGISFYDEALRERQAMERLIVESMPSALEAGQFSVYYQPKHDVHTGGIAGAEALVRWLHPELGFIRPDLFISVFERHGLIGELDRFVCGEVCKEIARIQELGLKPVPISINMSPIDFDDHDLADHVLEVAEAAGIRHGLLHVELTETAYAEDPVAVVESLKRLRKNGFKIELDDFGTGYSSLALLNLLPLDILKIDGSMVRNATRFDDYRIIQSAVHIAQLLGLETIIEGVETEEALDRLRDMGCDLIQGYYYSWPLRREDFEEYLSTH